MRNPRAVLMYRLKIKKDDLSKGHEEEGYSLTIIFTSVLGVC